MRSVNPYSSCQLNPRQLNFNEESVEVKQQPESEESRREVKIHLNPDQSAAQTEQKLSEAPSKIESI